MKRAKRPLISALPPVRLVSVEDECALKAKLFAARRKLYMAWYERQQPRALVTQSASS